MRRRTPITIAVVGGAIAACSAEPSGDEAGSHPLSAAPKDGIATFYDADGSGNCSFERSGDLDVVAMAMPEYDASAACGGCLRVTGPRGSIVVRVVDSCPPCAKSDVNLDLSASAFAKIAEPSEGRIPVRYQLVSCASRGNLAYHFKEGSSKYWTAIQVRNHKVPIASVAYARGGAFVAMKRESYNYFVEEKGVGDQPRGLTLRITATDGQVVEETLAGEVPDNETRTGTKQFE
jgi:expansin